MVKTLFNFVRGVLIGIAEVIPGVSGGTIALITGIYNRLLDNADLVFRSFLKISTPSTIIRVFTKLEWKLLIPVFTAGRGALALVGTTAGALGVAAKLNNLLVSIASARSFGV